MDIESLVAQLDARQRTSEHRIRDLEQEVLKDAKGAFSPEFFNRLDGALVFHPLSSEVLTAIMENLLKESAARFSRLGVTLTWEAEAARMLAARGDAKVYGARPLRRILSRSIEDPAARMLLSGELTAGRTLHAACSGNEVELAVLS